VWQIAQRDYRFGKGKHASLTKATYDAIGDCFRKLWGTEAGWAHSVLFTADLKSFSQRTVKAEVKTEETVAVKVETSSEVSMLNLLTTTRRSIKRERDEADGVAPDIVTVKRTVKKVKRTIKQEDAEQAVHSSSSKSRRR
jgi:N-glycosylase/DNA lyase